MIRKKIEMMMEVIIMAIVSLIIVTADAVADDTRELDIGCD